MQIVSRVWVTDKSSSLTGILVTAYAVVLLFVLVAGVSVLSAVVLVAHMLFQWWYIYASWS